MGRASEVVPPQPQEHRLEFVVKKSGIRFINDAMGKNVNTLWFALESLEAPIVLITLGCDEIYKSHENPYTMLRFLVDEKVDKIISIGEHTNKLSLAFRDYVGGIIVVNSVREAVDVAFKFSDSEDTVLFSPLCETTNHYSILGREFKKAVFDLSF